MAPRSTNMEPKGVQGYQNKAKMVPKGTNMEPKGIQKGAKWRPKCIKKSMFEKGRQKGCVEQTDLEPFLGAFSICRGFAASGAKIRENSLTFMKIRKNA